MSALSQTREWIFREDIDCIAGASNGPEIIRQLRHTWGIEIDMQRVERSDSDGQPCSPGRYRLTEQGRHRVEALEQAGNG